VSFGELLRRLRTEAGLTQEDLAAAAKVSPRSVSDLERGINQTPRKATAALLADALRLTGLARAEFEAAAQRRPSAGGFPAGHVIPRTLPRDIASFTGREAELRTLAGSVERAGGVAGIYAIGGMAGIGKTAFAVRAAHQLAPRFPDGQVFLPLHGHTPGRQPTDPAEALASLLIITGASPGQIPAGLEARMGVWRDRLAGKRLLLVLDDAADSEQVRPLLPSSGASLALVTSRHHLTALEDTTAVSLDTLPPDVAGVLLVKLANRPSLDPSDAAVGKITRLCGQLPLAVGMLARQLHHHASWTPADLAADLGAARDRLELMTTEALSVSAAFDLSYADLTADQQRTFRRLGLHLGTRIDGYAAAALIGSDLGTARRQLATLYDHYLLIEPARGQYTLHDLIREHARRLAANDPAGECDAAVKRQLDYYQRTAQLAESHIAAYTREPPAPSRSGPVACPDLRDTAEALAWARIERATLLACLDHVTQTDQHDRIVALTAGLSALMQHDGPYTDGVARHRFAVQAARKTGDRSGEAGALHDLGVAQYLCGDYLAAASSLEAARSTFRDLGNRQGEGSALVFLGTARRLAGDLPAAEGALEAGLSLCRALGDQLGQGWALMDLGVLRYQQGDPPAAVDALKEALSVYEDRGYRLGQANALVFLGQVQLHTGADTAAAGTLEEALDIAIAIGSRHVQANALTFFGDLRRRAGDYPAAARALEQAVSLFVEIGSPQGQANALLYLGAVRQQTADYGSAADVIQEALSICRTLGDPAGEAESLNHLGSLRLACGEIRDARACHRAASNIARKIGNPREEAIALAGLARCALSEGHTAEAETSLRQAQEMLLRIGDAEAASLATELADPGLSLADPSLDEE
jgi:tetratricopeptide (TPR) repeat protein/transcriptional regulator with XRE-family HTH domain